MSVDITAANGTVLSLPLTDISDGFIVEEITGLDPVKASLVSSSFANADGLQYLSSRRDARYIKMRIGLEPDYATETVQDLRRTLYDFVMPKSLVGLKFYTNDGPPVTIMARVESLETPLFTKEPSVDISMTCFDPDFIDPAIVNLTGSSTNGSTETLVAYDGTVDSGFLLTMNVNQTLDEINVYLRTPDQITRSMTFSAAMVNTDVVTISTVGGAKFVNLTQSLNTASALFGLSPQSSWLSLQPGPNYIRVYVNKVTPITWSLDYYTRYGGL